MMATYNRVRLVPAPPSPQEMLMVVFRATMMFYVDHREVAVPMPVLSALDAMYSSAQNPQGYHDAQLFVAITVIERNGDQVACDPAVIAAIIQAKNALKTYQA